MAAEIRMVSAASSRSHSPKNNHSSFAMSQGMYVIILVALFVGAIIWIYPAFVPPPPKICGSPGGPRVTAPRIRLKDGRHLAYREQGVPKERAKYKIVYIHGFDSCRYDTPPISTELAVELGIYLLSFDRPGYGESDPNPKRSEIGIASDVEELADQMELGATFYVIGFSMGGQATWGCLKHIPHRLAGATLLAPVVNYWWSGFPASLSKEAFFQQFVPDRWAVGVAHYVPWLTYWWNTQKWFPSSSVAADIPEIYSPADKQLFPKFEQAEYYKHQVRQQGEFESLHRDMMVGFGKWSFDPMDLKNPFPSNNGSVHLWHGDEDLFVPILLQRHVVKKLPWIHYHELPGDGHMFSWGDGVFDSVVRAMILGQQGTWNPETGTFAAQAE